MNGTNAAYLVLGIINGGFLTSSAWHHQTGFIILFSFMTLLCLLGTIAKFRE